MRAPRVAVESLESRRHFAVTTAIDALTGFPQVAWTAKQTLDAVPGSYIVTPKSSVSRSKADPNIGLSDILGTKRYVEAPSAIQSAMAKFPYPYTFTGYVGAYGSFSINVPDTVTPSAVRLALLSSPDIAQIVPNQLSPLASAVTPNPNPQYPLPSGDPNWWMDAIHMRSTGGTDLGAWDYSTGSSSIGIALIDSGLDIYKVTSGSTYANDTASRQGFATGEGYDVHPDLAPNIFVNNADAINGSNEDGNFLDLNGDGGYNPPDEPQFIDDRIGWDFYGDNSDPALGPIPDNNPTGNPSKPHGTQVAGILAADGSDGAGIAGVDWHSKVMPLKVSWSWGQTGASTGVTLDAVINAITYVNMMNDRGYNIRIITGAWGFYGAEDSTAQDGNSYYDLSDLSAALDAAASRGVLVVTAAQNRTDAVGYDLDSRTGDQALYPMRYTDPSYVDSVTGTGPKQNILVVAATAESGDLAKDDTYPPNAVPGPPSDGNNPDFSTNYGATEVQIAAPGTNILSTNVRPSRTSTKNPYTTVTTFGSSLAMPQVAGVAALALSMKPDLTVAQLKDAFLGYHMVGGVKVYNGVDTNSALSGKILTGGILNAQKVLSYVKSTYGNYLTTVIGDDGANPTDDEFRIYDKHGDGISEVTIERKNADGTWQYAGSCTDDPTRTLAIFGLGGNDKVTVLAGDGVNYDDIAIKLYINGGTGNDTITAGNANDTLIGENGDDSIIGASGDDVITLGNGNDYGEGSAGNDSINGNKGLDTIVGGKHNDTISGDEDNDKLYGYEGDDLLHGNDGTDTLYGDRADGVITDAGHDILYGDAIAGGLGNVFYTSDGIWDKIYSSDTLHDKLQQYDHHVDYLNDVLTPL